MTPPRFPAPWSVEDISAAFVVKDNGGQKLLYVYYEEEPGGRSSAKVLTRDKALRIAANVAKLPDLLRTDQVGGGPIMRIDWVMLIAGVEVFVIALVIQSFVQMRVTATNARRYWNESADDSSKLVRQDVGGIS